MRFKLAALAVTLAGFIAINQVINVDGQGRISGRLDEPGSVGEGLSEQDARLEQQLDAIKQMWVLVDSLDALGVSTGIAADMRRTYRSYIDQLEGLRISYFLSQTLWRQTLMNLLWAIFSTVVLLPIALFLDERYPGARSEGKATGPLQASPGGFDSDQDAS